MNPITLKDAIGEFHHQFATLASKEPLENPPSFHIFTYIKNAFAKSLSADEHMQMQLHLLSYEKSLAQARGGNKHQALFWINYIDNYPATLPPPVMKAMESLYFAMKAYYVFTLKNNEDALQYLTKAIERANSLASDNLPVMTATCYEQTLNQCRVYYEMGDLKSACSESGKLLLYIHTGYSQHHSPLVSIQQFVSMYPAMQEMMLHYVTNTLFAKLENIAGHDPSSAKVFYLQALKPLRAYTGDWIGCTSGSQNAVHALVSFFEAAPEVYVSNLADLLSDMQKVPRMLQKILLAKVLEISAQSGYIEQGVLENLVLLYAKTNLKSAMDEVAKPVPAT